MAQDKFKRKLTTIFSADVAGYSRLMGEDEAATVKTLEQYKEIMSELIRQHRGRIVDSPGDNLLAEFTSVVDAVQCAVATQKELQARNAELPENRKMQFRIGVNLGDVIEEESRIYGDGVNIAARLESLADPGGICVSKTAFDQIETKLPFGYEFLGEQTVKNIAKPVGAYRVLMEPRVTVAKKKKSEPRSTILKRAIVAGTAAALLFAIGFGIWLQYSREKPAPLGKASVEKMTYPLPDKPSIAVLPFANMSGDPQQGYLCDGLTEDLITALSKVPNLFVIARNSTFTYKGKPVKVKQVAEDLGVRYVLEGSIQKADDRVRITVQLIDALKGHHIWSERYDQEIKNVFALQDKIAFETIKAMDVKLSRGEGARIHGKGTDNLEAYIKFLQGREFVMQWNRESNVQARQLADEVIGLDPNYPIAYHLLAVVTVNDIWLGISKSPRNSLMQAIELEQKAIALDDSCAPAYAILGNLFVQAGEYEKGIAAGERAIEIAPNLADAYAFFAHVLNLSGRPGEAIPLIEKAFRLNPVGPGSHYYFNAANSYRLTGRYEDAVRMLKQLLSRWPNNLYGQVELAMNYTAWGREKEASEAVESVLRIDPKFSGQRYAQLHQYKDPEMNSQVLELLRKAGLPDKPPLPLPDKPSIAVLPFINMSKDPEQDYFGDGLAEEIINAIAKLPQVFVIARNSSFSFKGKPMDVRQMGRELGVKYVLEGSIRQEGKRVRITAKLVDTGTGHHVFSEKYDRHLQEIFATQDDITMRVVKALQLNLTEGEQALVYAKGTDNLEAYLKLLQATEYGRRQNPNDNEKAKRIIGEAIELDRNYPMAYRLLGALYMMEVWLGSSSSPQNSLQKAAELSQKAIDLDPSLGMAYAVLGHIHILSRDFQRGIELGQKAVELEPNGADSHAYLGMGLVFSDRAEEAVMTFKKAIRLNPDAPAWYLLNLATAYRVMGSYDEAIEWAKKAVERQPTNHFAHLVLTGSYSLAGREGESKAEADQVLRTNPKFSLERFAMVNPYKNQEAHKRYIDSLSKAGLK